MTSAVHRTPDVGNAARHAGGRFVMDDDDGFDLVRSVGGEPLFDRFG